MITLHTDQYTLFSISNARLLRMKNVSDNSCRGKESTHFNFSNVFENPAIYETMGKNTVEPGGPQMTIWRMRIAFWIPKAAITHSTATLVARMRPHVTLYVLCLSCFI